MSEIKDAVDQVKADMEALKTGVGQLQATSDALVKRIADQLAAGGSADALMAELAGIHADAVALTSSIAATVAADSPSATAPATTSAQGDGSGT